MSEENADLQAQGIFDAFRLLDRDLIDKVMAISKIVKIEQLEDGKVTRIIIDVVNQKN